MDEASIIRRDVYTLLNRLWNTYVYFCEYNQPEDGCEEREKIRDLIRELEQLMAAGKEKEYDLGKGRYFKESSSVESVAEISV